MRRLYRIRALQLLGLPLADIGVALEPMADDLASLRDLLEKQLIYMRRHAEQVEVVQDRIRDLMPRIDGAVMPATEQFLSTLEMIAVLKNHFTPVQRQRPHRGRQTPMGRAGRGGSAACGGRNAGN